MSFFWYYELNLFLVNNRSVTEEIQERGGRYPLRGTMEFHGTVQDVKVVGAKQIRRGEGSYVKRTKDKLIEDEYKVLS